MKQRNVFTNVQNSDGSKNKLIKVTDILGREVVNKDLLEHKVLIYIYDNGTVKRELNTF